MKVKVLQWHAVASWTWDAQDETCGICRMAFDGCCPDWSGSSRAKGRLMICQHQVFPQLLIELSRVDVLLGCRHVVICPESIILSGNQYVLYLPSVTASL
ncbi:hypothetical protein BRADI_1g64721v3 [Brachypodium distachyon]|uniref:Anaphase-promoting complex subunit 11 RING-H2 finger domain-containing protein n=1 Tax=Brachypodium distachyon TaxID=15368 RepID=A0A0Q3LG68_BRADI|nr:hypothetical protein BRADI_1g64721v3 [Brachypodium distachyon]